MTPDEHAAEAENLLKQAARPGLDDAAVQALAQTAIGHNLSALLASRPTTPDNGSEMDRGECGFCSGGPVVNYICPWHGNPKAVADELRARREHFDGPDRMELVRELREAVGLSTAASPMSPRQAWIEALDRARLATRPGPASELVRRAVRAETAELRAENERLRGESGDLDPESLGLEQSEPEGFYAFSGCDEVWLGLRWDIALHAGRWHVYRKGNWMIDVGSFQLALAIVADAQGEPVPSTGEDQSGVTWAIRVHPADETGEDQGDENCSRCGHLKTEHGFPYSIECDAEGCICGAFEPVPDEGSETGICHVFGPHCDCGGPHDEVSKR